MTSEVVRMHLAQALTRAETTDARRHVRAALNALDRTTSTKSSDGHLNVIEIAETELEAWLVHHATGGVPEVVLIGVLREYADRIETLGRVPRSWQHRSNQPTRSSSPPGQRSRPDDRGDEK